MRSNHKKTARSCRLDGPNALAAFILRPQGGQVGGPIKAKEHGLFTYYLLKGLGGTADANKDKKLTMAELTSYVSAKVKEDAAIKGREQTPELQGSANRVLVQW